MTIYVINHNHEYVEGEAVEGFIIEIDGCKWFFSSKEDVVKLLLEDFSYTQIDYAYENRVNVTLYQPK